MRLSGRRVLVTGAAGGIGAAIARHMVEEGARVVIADRALEPARAIATELGNVEFALEVDVASEHSVAAVTAKTVTLLGGLDVLVHCAGIGVAADFLNLSFEDWRRVLAINLDGTFLTCRATAQAMVAQGTGGAIVTIASTAGERPASRTAAYSASKAGVLNFTRAIALELAPLNIRANVISPGPTETDMVKGMHSAETRAAFTARVPLGRYAQPEEIAGAAVFLASDEASYITGEVIHVDGGYSSAGVLLPPKII